MARLNFLGFSTCLMIILISGTQNLQLVDGDAKLISQICAKTPSPTYCNQCLGPHTNENAKQLGATAINCSADAIDRLQLDFADCIEFGATPKFRDDCSDCLTFVSRGLADLEKALISYSQNRVSESVGLVRRAVLEYQKCVKVLGTSFFPQPLGTHLKDFQGFTDAALGVLQQQ